MQYSWGNCQMERGPDGLADLKKKRASQKDLIERLETSYLIVQDGLSAEGSCD